MGCNGHLPEEAASHGFFGSKAASPRNTLHRIVCGDEQLTCRFDAHFLDGARRRHPHLRAIMPNEGALAHGGAAREDRNGKVVGKMARHPSMELIEGTPALLKTE